MLNSSLRPLVRTLLLKTTTPGSYEVIKGLPMDDFGKQKIAATNKELVEERDAVKGMLK